MASKALFFQDIVNVKLHINTSSLFNLTNPVLRCLKSFLFSPLSFLIFDKKVFDSISITCDQYVFYSFYDQTKFRSFASFSTSLPLHVTLWLYPICRIVLIFIPGFIPNFIFRVHFRDPINSVSIYPAASQVNEQCLINIGHFKVPTDLIMNRIA